jgi:hypothetical protein
MRSDSEFLAELMGKRVRIIAVDEAGLPPLVLQEVSQLGVVAADDAGAHFFPWAEIVEIRPANGQPAEPDLVDVLAVDSEP